ncbi:crotonase/enoyl-CoA hydratase family protein [Mycolicibacterium pyrenivorans]|uniref:crotonase/enoyl-CoA hydratase family protein n=1 Tax=Mycolicibacterium pyrenivorans TaxID=187102 RepID=UPI0021F2E2C8|nr:crotonase/enoyl-CoA hydratase family protein [Mycolicibacterium pyrenivorans]MCV7153485.1 crotonase/enoyl-CoA hydratase family protein [Mycolicibacterium pyrenivorans]
MADEVVVERQGRTLVMTINRPEVKNAANSAVARGLADAVDELDANPDLSVGIITGAAGSFCAGADLKAMASGDYPFIEGRGLGFTEKLPRKPMISAVEGHAVGGGTELVLATDLIVAARSARFGLPEVKRGLLAGAGGLLRIQHRMPHQKAMELILTGDTFTGEDGLSLGFVNILAEDGHALDEALKLAERVSANGPLAIAASKEIVIKSADWSSSEMWQRQMEYLAPVFMSKDAQEGPKAFAEKREPNWTGT